MTAIYKLVLFTFGAERGKPKTTKILNTKSPLRSDIMCLSLYGVVKTILFANNLQGIFINPPSH